SPAAHGIYDVVLPNGSGQLRPVGQADLRERPYYDVIGEDGKRSVLVNLPLDHDGCDNAVIVNSWLTHDEERRIVPARRRSQYGELLKAYRALPPHPPDVDALCDIETARFDLARELFLREDWAHFFVLFSSTDWLGHAATGRFLRGDDDARDAFVKLYRQLDGYIGWLVERAGDAAVIVLSEHGQAEELALVRVNSILERLGYARSSRPGPYDDIFDDDLHARKPRATVHVPSAIARYRTNTLVRPFALGAKRAF